MRREKANFSKALTPIDYYYLDYILLEMQYEISNKRITIMTNNHHNSLLLNYHDACIYESDVSLLESKSEWLNDACIHFQIKRIEQQRMVATTSSTSYIPSKKESVMKIPIIGMKFLDPLISSFFMHQLSIYDEDDYNEIISLCHSWDLMYYNNYDGNECKMMIIPINDNNSANYDSFQRIGSGHHWSLLVVVTRSIGGGDSKDSNSRHSFMYFHFDSSKGCNHQTAICVAKKIEQMYSLYYQHHKNKNKKNQNDDNEDDDVVPTILPMDDNDDINVFECNVAQQENGNDCGIHTLFNAQIISTMTYITLDDNMDTVKQIGVQLQQHLENEIMLQYQNNVMDMTTTLRTSIAKDIRTLSTLFTTDTDTKTSL